VWRAVSHRGGLAAGGDGGIDRWRCSWRQPKDTTSKDKRPPQENQFSQRTYFPRFPLLLNTTHYRDPPRAQRRRRRRETAAKETFPPTPSPQSRISTPQPSISISKPNPRDASSPLLPKTNQSRSANQKGARGGQGRTKSPPECPPQSRNRQVRKKGHIRYTGSAVAVVVQEAQKDKQRRPPSPAHHHHPPPPSLSPPVETDPLVEFPRSKDAAQVKQQQSKPPKSPPSQCRTENFWTPEVTPKKAARPSPPVRHVHREFLFRRRRQGVF